MKRKGSIAESSTLKASTVEASSGRSRRRGRFWVVGICKLSSRMRILPRLGPRLGPVSCSHGLQLLHLPCSTQTKPTIGSPNLPTSLSSAWFLRPSSLSTHARHPSFFQVDEAVGLMITYTHSLIIYNKRQWLFCARL